MDFSPDQSPNTKRIDRYFYSMSEKLGQGAFGTVYLGHDIDDKHKLYAIKVIPVTIIKTDPALEESLMNEMQVMKLLNHPNIVHCFDVLSSSNNHYFVMEYCAGGTLSGHLKKRGRLQESEALTILVQILKGYYEMLKLGIIHRDLKPDNILVHDAIFKLADFGFAKCVDNFSKDLLKSLVGTPLYMSPQILQQQEYTTKTDLWSIALIYYEMLCGKTPWDAKTQYELVTKILGQPVKFPSDAEISEQSKSFIRDALKVDESARLSWDQVFSHELFNDCFDYKRRRTTLKQNALNYQAMLKSKIIEKNIDLFKFFSLVDKNKNNQIEIDEFTDLMKKLDDKITREQIEFIFNTIDEDGNNSVSLFEFRKWLTIQTPIQQNPIPPKPSPPKADLHRNQSLPFNPNLQNQSFQNPSSFSPNIHNSNYNNNQPNYNNSQSPQGFTQASQGTYYNQQPGPYPPTTGNYHPSGFTMHPAGPTHFGPSSGFASPYGQGPGHGSSPGPIFNQGPMPHGTGDVALPSQGGSTFPGVGSSFQGPGAGPINYNNNYSMGISNNNCVPMMMSPMQGYAGGAMVRTQEIIKQLRFTIAQKRSNVEHLFNFAKGDKPDLDKYLFWNLLQIINLQTPINENEFDMVFKEFDLDRDGKISLNEFKKIILNI